MAVLDSVPGIEVTVEVDGTTATEYDDPEGNDSRGPGTVTKYIESVDEAHFSIAAKVSDDYNWGYRGHELGVTIAVDGKPLEAARRILEIDTPVVTRINGVREQKRDSRQWILRKLRFAAVTTGQSSLEREAVGELGTITVKVHRKVRGEERKRSHVHKEHEASPLHISEKALKGRSVSHGTRFTDGEPIEAPRYTTTKSIYIDQRPLAIFHFFYRSREALMNELVIPRELSPDPADNLSATEVRRLARGQSDTKVKFENKPQASIKREHGETVDLTGEGSEEPDIKRKRRLSPIDLTGC